MERNFAIDFIKFFAILAVVIIHTVPSDHKLGLFILDNISRFAVPFFFAASGYLFGLKVINNQKSTGYFKRYLIKILKIYICWLLFYIGYDVLRIFLSGGNVEHELSKYVDGLTALNLFYFGKGTSGYQLWFVISLAWSTAILYIFFRLKKITLLLILSLCLNIAAFGQSYSIFFDLPLITRDALFIGLFYTTLGFWFAYALPSIQSLKLKKQTYFYLLSFLFVLQVAEGYWLEKMLSAEHGEYFLSTIFLTVILLLFTCNNQQLGKGLWITKIGGNALGIYAVHVLLIDIVDILFNTIGVEHFSHQLLWDMMDAFLVFSLSYITYYFLQYIKSRQPFWR
ncbi:acyltransferase [Neobacillus sp. PS3-34]|uniref:acyltransferase n=1 Tax=Neobacillus sp. PS3-34 TaxID=3070678 RepID=UPI0027E0CDDB|nr:acyltransferase [Neobacillus sp. PS3-34]WML48369.1 acyltransferase [Neobacillus sp. PS3-34]